MNSALKPIDRSSEWDARKARHLLNRAGFGVPNTVVERLVSMGAEGAVDAFVQYDRFADNIVEPDWLSAANAYEAERKKLQDATPEERQKALNDFRRQERQDVERLKVWWLDHMRATKRPLQEKLALFWHGHFATSAQKVRQPAYNLDLNKTFRRHAAGNFKTLVFEVGKSPAMLVYLDNRENRRGNPNENWARELMELFTIGIGNYTEQDIKEAARAFSGYTLVRDEFRFVPGNHDSGEKKFLGKTGKFDGADVINIIFEQPQTARFIAKKLWEYFAYEDPSDAIVEGLAEVLREGDYELKPMLRAMFLSREFYSDRAVGFQIKSPAQYLVMLMDQLRMESPRDTLVNLAMRGLGQDLFHPPNVKGWEGNRAWINTNTLLTRYNIPNFILTGQRPDAPRPVDLEQSGMQDGMEMGMDAAEEPDDARFRRTGGATLAEARRNLRRGAPKTLVDIKPILEAHTGRTCGGAVDGLVAHFIGRRIDDDQRDQLLRFLDPTGRTAVPFDTKLATARGPLLVQMILSMAEYQLC